MADTETISYEYRYDDDYVYLVRRWVREDRQYKEESLIGPRRTVSIELHPDIVSWRDENSLEVILRFTRWDSDRAAFRQFEPDNGLLNDITLQVQLPGSRTPLTSWILPGKERSTVPIIQELKKRLSGPPTPGHRASPARWWDYPIERASGRRSGRLTS